MKNTMKKLVTGILGIGMLAFGLAGKSFAMPYSDALNTNNTAQITITITPNVDRSVTIDTATVNMDLGSVALGVNVTTQTEKPALVTIGGTYGNTDLWLSANITGGWSLDTDDTAGQNTLATWVTFTNTGITSAPSRTGSNFNGAAAAAGADLVDGSFTRVGADAASGAGRFEDGTTDTNGMAVGQARNMWTYFRMPDATTTTNAQKITFVLTVDQGI